MKQYVNHIINIVSNWLKYQLLRLHQLLKAYASYAILTAFMFVAMVQLYYYSKDSSLVYAANNFLAVCLLMIVFGLISNSAKAIVIAGGVYQLFISIMFFLESAIGRELDGRDLFLSYVTERGEAVEFISDHWHIVIFIIFDIVFIIYASISSNSINIGGRVTRALFLIVSATFVVTGFAADQFGVVNKIIDWRLKFDDAYQLLSQKQNTSYLQSFNFDNVRSDDKAKIVVLVIGESARYDRFSVNGYHRNTTPNLSNLDELISCKDVVSGANGTFLSLPLLVTRATPLKTGVSKKERSIARLFEQAGYTTAWVSEQGVNLYPPDTNIVINNYIQGKGATYQRGVYDGQLIDELKKLTDKYNRLFVVLHMYGSHFVYDLRYPLEYKKYMPTISDSRLSIYENKLNLDNSYDNTILYTDYVLGEISRHLNSLSEEAVALYTSDHGENLLDDQKKLLYHLTDSHSIYEVKVPLFVFANKLYINNHSNAWQTMIENENKRITHDVVFYTLASLGDIIYSGHSFKNDITSKDLNDIPIRVSLKETLQKSA
jgi:glucan phosphoethanolaminetransferase (alkaline phosphatase superfamily)